MIERVEQLGVLVGECAIAGETKADGMCPGHGNAIPLSRNRWLLIYPTRAYRHGYALRSIVYQLRAETPVGRVIREGLLERFQDGWDRFGDGRRFYKELGNVSAFGVPKGALIKGSPAPHANLFVVKWCLLPAKIPQPDPWQDGDTPTPNRLYTAMDGEWVQFRLNDRDDDIEIVQPIRPLRQTGCETGKIVGFTTDGEPLRGITPGIVNAVPANDRCMEWAEVNRFHDRRRAVVKYRYKEKLGLYEWVQTGPLTSFGNSRVALGWASLLRTPADWIIAANKTPLGWPVRPMNVGADRQDLDPDEIGVAWIRSEDPWRVLPPPVCPTRPATYASPITAYRCADGVVRLFGGDQTLCEPPRGRRNPLRCWDIDPDNAFAVVDHRVIFDAFDAGLRLQPRSATEPESTPAADKAKLLTHTGGNQQYLIHPVRLRPAEIANAGLYCQKLIYDRQYPGEWTYE